MQRRRKFQSVQILLRHFREALPGRLFIMWVLAPYMPSAVSIMVSVRVGCGCIEKDMSPVVAPISIVKTASDMSSPAQRERLKGSPGPMENLIFQSAGFSEERLLIKTAARSANTARNRPNALPPAFPPTAQPPPPLPPGSTW